MSDNLSTAQFGSACPECGTAGKPGWGKGLSEHVETPGHCHTYQWESGGSYSARDVHTKDEREARSDAIDARLARLNPLRRKRESV